MVKKLVVLVGILGCSGTLISTVEAGKKSQKEDGNFKKTCISVAKLRILTGKPELNKLGVRRKIYRTSKRVIPYSSEETVEVIQPIQHNPYTAESLRRTGKTKGLPRPKRFQVIKKLSSN